MHGAVTDYSTGQAIEGAELDVWGTLLVGFMSSKMLCRRTTMFGAGFEQDGTEIATTIACDQRPSS